MRRAGRGLIAGLGLATGLGLVGLNVARSQARAANALSEEMAAAAGAFVATLDDAGRAKAMIPLEDPERFNFNYVPMERRGLPLKEMSLEQRRAAHALLRTVLSSKGYLKATGIMQLEEILFVLENNAARRDRELYYVSIFGDPSAQEPWGWRFEGHHLSLNYTSSGNQLTAVTPSFFGSNPAEVRQGPMAGLRVLGSEEDLARALLASFSAEQRTRAVINENAPNDVVTTNERRVELDRMDGLPASEMSEPQRELLMRIVDEYAHNLRPDLADAHLARIREAGIENLHFAWMGSTERGRGHYYRIHGPNVLFEYDNVQNNGNHVHSVWRDIENDFGEDMLERHYAEHPH